MREFPPIDRAAEAAASQTLFFTDGEFDGRPHRVSRFNYLAFLSLTGSAAQQEVDKIRSFLGAQLGGQLETDIVHLLGSLNWRYHNIACIALAAGFTSPRTIEALWQRIRAGSWTAPQLVATAAYIDAGFQERAADALASHATYYKSLVALAALAAGSDSDSDSDIVAEAKAVDRDDSGAIAIGWLHNLRQALG